MTNRKINVDEYLPDKAALEASLAGEVDYKADVDPALVARLRTLETNPNLLRAAPESKSEYVPPRSLPHAKIPRVELERPTDPSLRRIERALWLRLAVGGALIAIAIIALAVFMRGERVATPGVTPSAHETSAPAASAPTALATSTPAPAALAPAPAPTVLAPATSATPPATMGSSNGSHTAPVTTITRPGVTRPKGIEPAPQPTATAVAPQPTVTPVAPPAPTGIKKPEAID